MKQIILILQALTILFLTLFLVGCGQLDLSGVDLSKVDPNKAISCDKPYIRHGYECCLDVNENKICDKDERQLTTEISTKTTNEVSNVSSQEQKKVIMDSKIENSKIVTPTVIEKEKTIENKPIILKESDYKNSCTGGLVDYPNMFVKDGKFDGYFVVSETGSALDNLVMTDISTSMKYKKDGSSISVIIIDVTRLDSEISDLTEKNMIVIGNACYNQVTAKLLNNPSDCKQGLVIGGAVLKLIEHSNGKKTLLIMGYDNNGEDNQLAGKFIAHRQNELNGKEVIIEGTTYTDATTKCKD